MVRYSNGHSKFNMEEIIRLIKISERPLIIAGGGIRLSKGVSSLRKLVSKLKIPVVAPLMGIDLFEAENRFYMGHGGSK